MESRYTFHTTHLALHWLFSLAEPSGSLMRWKMQLSEFNYQVQYNRGAIYTQATSLSRLSTIVETEPVDNLKIT